MTRLLTVVLVSLLSTLAHADILLNSGGPQTGEYLADQYYSGGRSRAFFNQQGVYASERNSRSWFSYAIPVVPGDVQVTLRFRESRFWCGWLCPNRIFSVAAEGGIVEQSIQIPRGSVVDYQFTVQSDSILDLTFTAINAGAFVNAIEVVSSGSEPPPAPTLSFNVAPTSIETGESALLSWTSTDADGCSASIGWSGPKSPSGTESVTPSTTTTYGLTCGGAGGSVSNQLTLTVTEPEPPDPDAISLLHVSAANSRYFENANQEIVVLAGSHNWFMFIDHGFSNPPPASDYEGYLDFLEAHGHNFFKLWTWEQARWAPYEASYQYRFNPPIYARTGPGTALDGLPKFDLTKFNQAYFDRMRTRIEEAADRKIYVSVMLFNGWSLGYKGAATLSNPWRGHPFNAANNINGIDGDTNNDGFGHEVDTLGSPAILDIQKAYVAKVIDTVNDLDNVLYEISNESESNSEQWQYEMIDFIRTYESTKPKQHPIGMTVEFPDGSNAELLNSNADWVSLDGSESSPPVASGVKVILSDTDHLCGICGDRQWAWKAFVRGANPIFMDIYDAESPGSVDMSSDWVSIRNNLGYILEVSREFDLKNMRPVSGTTLCSTGYCLADTVGGQFIVYAPGRGSIRVQLPSGSYEVEWLRPANGVRVDGGTVSGGQNTYFSPPFWGDAVLLLKR